MKYESIADIYSANEKIRGRFNEIVGPITPEEAAALPDGEKWSIQKIVEHVSMVESGASRICSRLVGSAKAEGKASDGSFSLGPTFGEKAAQIAALKVEAPEMVQPTGEVAILDALARLTSATEAIKGLRGDLESFDLSSHTFPHPFFGPLTAGEWLVIAGLHEQRHTSQIEGVLAKIRA